MGQETSTGLLALAAAATALPFGRPAGSDRIVRLTAACVVAGAVALPLRDAALIAVAALLTGGGVGLSASPRPGWRPALAAAAGAAAAIVAARAVPAADPLLASLASYGALVGAAAASAAALGALDAIPRTRIVLYEVVNVPAAFLLVDRIRADDVAGVVCLLILLAGGGYALAALARALGELTATNDALASRVSELATLHAIGREILATLDPERIFAIVERECRKILSVDFFFIGTLDRETNEIRLFYRAAGEQAPHETLRPLGDGLASWIVREKRALRIEDVAEAAESLPFRPQMIDRDVRSVLAVPLLVDDRAVGVLSVQSRTPRAYDEHQLSVLATIAQQTAVAVENARHYALATIDSLTGLYLRDYFFRRLEEEHTRAKRYAGAFSILMLDLDGFKDINDRQGHLAGDRYLRAVGTTIHGLLRGADLACRYGGDEFCVLLPETDLAGARPIAERVRLAIANLVVDVDGSAMRTTVSIGVASYPEHDAGELKSLLLRADQALYQAKRSGRDRVVPFAA